MKTTMRAMVLTRPGRPLQLARREVPLADSRYCFPLPDDADAASLAPPLCAGLIGYRALTLAGDARSIGLYGFGAAARILCQVAAWQGRRVYAFTRPGDTDSQRFALERANEALAALRAGALQGAGGARNAGRLRPSRLIGRRA